MNLNSRHERHRYPSSFPLLVAKWDLLVAYSFTVRHVSILKQCCNCEECLTYENCYYCYCADKNYSFRLQSNYIGYVHRVLASAAVQKMFRLFWFDGLRNSREERTPQLNHLTVSGVQFVTQFMQ